MKTVISVMALMMVGMVTPLQLSATDSTGTKVPPKKVILRHTKHDPLRPNAPSLVTIECAYGDGVLLIQLPAGVYYANLRLSNDTYVWEGLVTADAPMVEIPSLTGEYTLLCQTDDGRLFTGLLEF